MTIQAHSVNTITGTVMDRIPVSDFTGDRLLAAKGTGKATIPLGGTYTTEELRSLTEPWARTLVLERDDVVKFAGIVVSPPKYKLGGNEITCELVDLWGLWERRGAWGDSPRPGNVEKWSISYSNLSRGTLAKRAVQRGTAPFTAPNLLPNPALPITLPADVAGTLDREYFGYHLETVADVLSDLMAEGLDVDFQPRWVDGKLDWLMRTGQPFSSGTTHELYPMLPKGVVTGFSESGNGERVTNNAINIGEGSEEDMLARSLRNLTSPLPLLERVTQRKNITDPNQLSAISAQDLVTYGSPTVQWDFSVLASTPIDLGDTVKLHFHGDDWIADGWHSRRVVKLSHGVGNRMTVGVQPTGGA